jgi:hypothetical protein
MSDHVFDILFESGFQSQCAWLPRGTRVRIVRSGTTTPSVKCRASCTDNVTDDVEGKAGTIAARHRAPLDCYQVELDLNEGMVYLDVMFLEPIVQSRAEAVILVNRTLESDGDAPAPRPAPVTLPVGIGARRRRPASPAPPLIEEEDFADDSPL